MRPHVYRIFIRAPRERVWQSIVDPEFTRRYFHETAFTSTLEVGAGYRYVLPDGDDAVVGVVEVVEPPRRLVMTWRILYDAAAAAEPPSRVEWLLTDAGPELTRVDVVHGDLAASPVTWASVRTGWVWVLDSMKSLLETGRPLPRVTPDAGAEAGADGEASAESTIAAWHRTQAIDANNSVWPLLTQTDRTADDDEELLRRAYAAAYHWQRAQGRTPANEVRATYMIAKAQLAVGERDGALRSARRCLDGCIEHGLDDFDLAYAHEVMARALHATGDEQAARTAWEAALAVPIADPEDRALVESDLADGLG